MITKFESPQDIVLAKVEAINGEHSEEKITIEDTDTSDPVQETVDNLKNLSVESVSSLDNSSREETLEWEEGDDRWEESREQTSNRKESHENQIKYLLTGMRCPQSPY